MFNNLMIRVLSVLCLQLVTFSTLFAESSIQGASFEIGPSLSHIAYKEPGYMEDKGFMYGMSASYSLRKENLGPVSMIKAEVQATWGSINYSSVSTGSIHATPDSMIEGRVLLGTNLHSADQTLVTPYAGLGYRKLTDKSEGMISSSGAFGYDREANYRYAPVGIEFTSSLETGWIIGGMLEYDFFFDGTQITSIPRDMRSNGVTVSNQFTNDQRDGYGFRTSLKIMKRISDTYCLVFEPYCRYWNIKESRPDSIIVTDAETKQKTITVVEPSNNSTEYGIMIGLRF